MTALTTATTLPKATADSIAIIVSDRLIISDPKIEPVYNATKGLIADKLTHRPMFTLPGRPWAPYFWYELRFCKYNYHKAYNPLSQSYQKTVCSRSFSMYLHIDITLILKIQTTPRLDQMMWDLGYALSKIQVYEIRAPNKYNLDITAIKAYLNSRRTNYMYMVPWFYYRLDLQHVFDLKSRSIAPLTAQAIPKVPFMLRGCLIETNDASRLIGDHFRGTSCDAVTLVMLPQPMAHLWDGRRVRVLTLAQLTRRLDGSDAWSDSILEGIQQLIIHECHEGFLTEIKRIVSSSCISTIWVINSLPLHYYFSKSTERPDATLKVHTADLASMMNLWAFFTNEQKTEYQTEIYKTIFTMFNQLYATVTYESSSIESIRPDLFALSPFESRIWHSFYGYYNNWLHSLTNDPSNRYSMTNTRAAYKLEAKVQQSIHQLLSTIVPQCSMHKHYGPHIAFVIQKIQQTIEDLRPEIRKYLALDKDTITKIGDTIVVNPHQYAATLQALEQSAISIHRNYERYKIGSVYRIEADASIQQLAYAQTSKHSIDLISQLCQPLSITCPICYSDTDTDTELVWTQFVCGHVVCLDCVLGSIRASNSCPICKEFINTQRIAVIADTSCLTEQSVYEYVSSLDSNSLIITDLDVFTNGPNRNCKATVVNVCKHRAGDVIRGLNIGLCREEPLSLNQVVLLTTSPQLQRPCVSRTINKIVNYLQQIDDGLELRRIELVSQTM